MNADIPNVLADRYATPGMRSIWSATGRIRLERELWIAVMKAQRDLGVKIPAEAITAYEQVRDQIDPESIRRREQVTRHDVKARIEEFSALAGCEHIHKGMTSRDLTESVEQLQILRSLQYLLPRAVAALLRLAGKATEYRDVLLASRTHNVPAQPTTLGKRLAMFGEEFMRGCTRLVQLIDSYPARGLKGAAGTQLDQLTLLDGDPTRVNTLEQRILQHLGFAASLHNVGQVYPRSLDFEVVAALFQLACGPSSFARTLRLMAGHELAGEGFAPGQVGSSSMPHKMNSRSCERINGLHAILRGHLAMASALAGDQWNEGDVSCSVVRRVALPDSFFAIDGLMETWMVVLDQMEAYPAMIAKENQQILPFLATTTILMEAVKAGAGRESAHQTILHHAVNTVKDLRDGRIQSNNLLQRLADDPNLPLNQLDLDKILQNAHQLAGAATSQVDAFISDVDSWAALYPEALDVSPGPIL